MAGKLPDVTVLGDRPTPQPAQGIASYQVPRSGDLEDPGKALEAAGSMVAQLGAHFQEKQDTTRVEDAWNQYKNAALDVTVGDNGVLNKKGGDAVNGNLLQTTGQALGTARGQIEASLTNDEQRRRFSERATVTDLQIKHQVLSHLSSEQTVYDKTVMMGSEAAAKAQINAMPMSPDVFKQARDTLMAQSDTFLNSQGVKDKASRDAYKDKVNDSLWKTRIDALLYSQPILAEAMFRANAKEIKNPELRLQMQAQTREAALGVNASIEAQKAIDETRAGVSPLKTPERATPEGGPATAGQMTDTGMKIPQSVQTERDQTRLRILRDELKDNPDDLNLRRELRDAEAKSSKVSSPTSGALPQPTNALPNARDVAAQLPVIMAKVEKKANDLYGPDQGNPDRAAFIRRMTGEVHAKLSADVQQLNAIEKQAQGQLIDAIAGIAPSSAPGAPGAVKTGATGAQASKITSFGQIQADPQLFRAYQLLDYQGKLAVDNMISKNLKDEDKGDVVLYRQLWNQIHLPDGDPKKIYFYKQVTDPAVADRLSIAQIGQLRAEIDRPETMGDRTLVAARNNADAKAQLYFKTHLMFTAQPERQIAAGMQWNEDVGKQIDTYIKDGHPEKVRAMFQLDTPETVLGPFKDGKLMHLETYINSTPAAGLAGSAAAVKGGTQAPVAGQSVAPPVQIKTDADYDALPPGALFLDPTGKQRQKPGTPPLIATQGQGVWAPNQGDLRQDGTQKGTGFLGPLVRPDGKTSTEISISTNAVGKKDFPLLVPTLTKDEVTTILAIPVDDPKFFDKVPRSAVAKAEAFAESRLKEGKPLFAQPGEQPGVVPTMNEQGKLVTPAPPATTAPAAITADSFEIKDAPTTTGESIAAIRKARAKALDIRQGGAQGPQFELFGPTLAILKSAMAVHATISEAIASLPRALGEKIAQAIPTELEAVHNGFEAIKKARKVSPQDADILTEVLRYGLLPPADQKLAQDLLGRLQARK